MRGQTRHDRRGKLHRGVGADFYHEIAHFQAFCPQPPGLSRVGRGQGQPHFLQLEHRAYRILIVQDLPHHG